MANLFFNKLNNYISECCTIFVHIERRMLSAEGGLIMGTKR